MFRKVSIFVFASICLISLQNCYLSDSDAPAGFTDDVSFSTDVIGIFKSSCIASGCHTGTEPGGNLNLDAGSSDITSVYVNVQKEINLSKPDTSVLLSKASNKATHTGGAILLETSSDYAKILKWIKDGAINDDCTGVPHSFATNIVPIFTQCTSAGCHDVTVPVLSSTPFENIEKAKSVDKTNPAKSSLLRKPLGLDTHNGGAIFSNGNDLDYKIIYCWIKVDAAANN